MAFLREVAISDFKTKCVTILERVRKSKQPIRITRNGRAIADVIPVQAPRVVDRGKWIGSMKGSMEIIGDIIAPASDEDEWEALRD